MPTLPQLSDLSNLVAALDRHPFGTLAFIVLAGLALGALLAVKRRK